MILDTAINVILLLLAQVIPEGGRYREREKGGEGREVREGEKEGGEGERGREVRYGEESSIKGIIIY